MNGKSWSPAELERLRAEYPDRRTEDLAAEMGRKTRSIYSKAGKEGLRKSLAYLASPDACRLRRGDSVGADTRFKPGQVPPNKGLRRSGWSSGRMRETQFLKGERRGVAVKLYKPIGTERISKDGYLERKINDDLPLQARWRAVHLIMWEQAYGPLPVGHAVSFKNGDRSDIRIENFQLIARADLMRRNSIHALPPQLKNVLTLKGALVRRIRKLERANAEKQA